MKLPITKLIGFTVFFALAFLVKNQALAAPFIVDAPTPSTTFINQTTTFSSTIGSGVVIIDHCGLSVDGNNVGNMTLYGGTSASLQTSITTSGSHIVRTTCYDATGTHVDYKETTVTVFADSNSPYIGSFILTPTAPIAGSSVTIQANYDDTDFGSGIDGCTLFIDGTSISLMNLSGGSGSTAGTVSRDYTFPSAGTHSTKIECIDRSGNVGSRTESVTVDATLDTVSPVVGSLNYTPSSPSVGTTIILKVTATDNVAVSSCQLYKEGTPYNTMTAMSGDWEAPFTATEGTHRFYAYCQDAVGNTSSSPDFYITITASSADTTPPVVSALSPTTAVQDTEVTYSATFSDDHPVTSCSANIQVGSGATETYTMSQSGTTSGVASLTWTYFSTNTPAGTYNAYVTCKDSAGNVGTGPTTSISVMSPDSLGPYANRLVKLACPAGPVSLNAPCKAVYYVGSDGKRHAFPNEKVYFTWYTDFSSIIELNATTLSSIPLGRNVNYRPGVRMVKFTTLNKVYAVGRYGELRWVTNETVVRNLYGSNWNTKIDDISDAFFSDYTFGADITSAGLYSPSYELSLATSINANIR